MPLFSFIICLNFRKIKEIIVHENYKKLITDSPLSFRLIFNNCVQKISKPLLDSYSNFLVKKIYREPIESPSKKSRLCQDYESLYSDMVFTDAELVVGGRILRVHKVILSSELIWNSRIYMWILFFFWF